MARPDARPSFATPIRAPRRDTLRPRHVVRRAWTATLGVWPESLNKEPGSLDYKPGWRAWEPDWRAWVTPGNARSLGKYGFVTPGSLEPTPPAGERKLRIRLHLSTTIYSYLHLKQRCSISGYERRLAVPPRVRGKSALCLLPSAIAVTPDHSRSPRPPTPDHSRSLTVAIVKNASDRESTGANESQREQSRPLKF